MRQHCRSDLDYLLESYVEDCFEYWQQKMLQIFHTHGRKVDKYPVGEDLEIAVSLLLRCCQSDAVFSFILPLLAELEGADNARGVVTWTTFWRLAEGAMKVKASVPARIPDESREP